MQVRGSVIEARIKRMQAEGVEAFARFLTSLSPGARALADGELRPEGFYDVALFHEVLEVIDRQLGDGDLTLCYELGRWACDQNLSSFHRFFLRLSSMEQMVDRATAAWRVHYRGAELSVTDRGPGWARLRIDGHPAPHRGFCLSVKGWIVRMGEHTGADVEAVEEECQAIGDPECAMTFRW